MAQGHLYQSIHPPLRHLLQGQNRHGDSPRRLCHHFRFDQSRGAQTALRPQFYETKAAGEHEQTILNDAMKRRTLREEAGSDLLRLRLSAMIFKREKENCAQPPKS